MGVLVTQTALRQLKALPKADAKRILAALNEIASAHPKRMAYVTELAGSDGAWRARKGDYRAIYKVTETHIVVIAIGNRKDIYK